MKVIKSIEAWRELRPTLTGSLGFVATMGALHDGHASLMHRSVAENDLTVLSIYVNPTQFNDPKDLSNYPDTMQADLDLAQGIGVDYVIVPTYDDMYADGYRYQVTENQFSEVLCGANRPGHFTGVLSVVMKLLNLVRADRAYFGKKDYQQYLLIKEMCAAFFMDVDIIGCDTVRECDGLAMSSRNKLLTPAARRMAHKFHDALASSLHDTQVRELLTELGFQVDYVETRDERRFGAVVVDCDGHEVRLIDNVDAMAANDGADQMTNVG